MMIMWNIGIRIRWLRINTAPSHKILLLPRRAMRRAEGGPPEAIKLQEIRNDELPYEDRFCARCKSFPDLRDDLVKHHAESRFFTALGFVKIAFQHELFDCAGVAIAER